MNTTVSPKSITPWLTLVSRSLLFLFFQALVALVLSLAGVSDAWEEFTRWWLFTVNAANLAGVGLLVRLFRAEGKRYLDLLCFSKATLGKTFSGCWAFRWSARRSWLP